MPAGRPTGDLRDGQLPKVRDSASFLADNFERAPLMMIPCIQGRLENLDVATGAGGWGSLLPAVWSFMLALRNRGIGSAWTTIHLISDGEKKAAELLGIPFDKFTQGGLFPIAYTKGTEFQPAKRLPLEKVLLIRGESDGRSTSRNPPGAIEGARKEFNHEIRAMSGENVVRQQHHPSTFLVTRSQRNTGEPAGIPSNGFSTVAESPLSVWHHAGRCSAAHKTEIARLCAATDVVRGRMGTTPSRQRRVHRRPCSPA